MNIVDGFKISRSSIWPSKKPRFHRDDSSSSSSNGFRFRMNNYIIAILIGFLFIGNVNSMIFERKITFHTKFYLIEQFGFEDQGTIDLRVSNLNFKGTAPSAAPVAGGSTATIPPQQAESKLTLWVCQDREYQSLIGSSPTNFIENKLCNDPSAGNCPIKNQTITDGLEFHSSITDSDMYRLIILKCTDDREVTMKLNYILKNPNGHLSKGYLPLPALYRYMAIVMTLLFIGVLAYWIIKRQYLNPVHYILILIVALRLILVYLTFHYWTNADTVGKFNHILKYFQNIFFSFTETTFFASLFVLSRGWKITRQNLTRTALKSITIILVFLLSVLLFFSFYNDVYYFLSLMILYFFMMPTIFTNITKNIRIVESHAILARFMENQITMENISLKKKVFRYLRTTIVLYLGAILFVNSMKIIMVWFLFWISFSISEPISILMISFLCFTFRPTNVTPNIYQNAQLDEIGISEISRSLEQIINQNLDPVSLSNILEIKSFNPSTCFIIQYPSNRLLRNSYSIAVQE
ncbi:hypothetical protein CYY_009639 [Polysphondylium violaceum]|uniref:Uncharacterized protein n=1 Tax=Polysphondylium violaceum TaxID=133409 RepID=A0A8J4PTB6_9MYCE|nr:hypothetical protein CYY_009639 [Polysphondylium violaceum]